MKKILASMALVGAAAIAAPAMAGGGGPFEAEVDCDGVFNPGDTVPWQIRFENQLFQAQTLDVDINISVPAIGSIDLINVTFNLGPNQDLAIPRTLRLPTGAPRGQYQFVITANSGTASTFDTCSFDVI